MAYEIGNAAGHYDFLTKIRTFVETTLPIDERYTVMREVTVGDDKEVIWKAPGSGGEEIFFGLKTYQSVTSDYYNFKIGCFTGYVESSLFETQPGTCTIKGIPLWNHIIPYWLIANGRGFTFGAKIENVYVSGITGKFLQYNTPTQYPYPVCCGGCLTTASATRYSDTTYNAWFTGSALEVRAIDGAWVVPDVYPYDGTRTLRNTVSLSTIAEGYYGLHAIILSRSAPDIFGEIENVFYISGFNNAAENSFVDASIPYVVLRNVWRTGFKDYIALRLD